MLFGLIALKEFVLLLSPVANSKPAFDPEIIGCF
jgi:hypothetical protein